ncbi:MAG: hypothetical protein AB8H03_24800 [Saprospiraceae bacterium]
MRNILFFLFLICSPLTLFGQQNEINPLLSQLQLTTTDSSKIDIYLDLIEICKSIDIDSSVYYYNQISPLLNEKTNYTKLWKSTFSLVKELNDKGDFQQTKDILDEIIPILKTYGDNNLIAEAINSLAIWNWLVSNLKEAQLLLNQALEYAKKTNNKSLKADIFNTFGLINMDMENTEAAFEYHEKALKMFVEAKDTIRQAKLLNNIGYSYIKKQEYHQAAEKLNEAITFLIDSRYDDYYELTLANLGFAEIGIGEIEVGFNKINTAYNLAKQHENLQILAVIIEMKTKWYLKLAKYQETIDAAYEGIEICEQINLQKNIHRFYQKLSDAYLGQKKYKDALFWSNKSNQANQELLKQQQNKEVMKLQIQYNVQQKQAENEVLLLQNKNQNIFIALLAAIYFVLLFSLFYFFKKNQKKQLERFRQKIAADLHDDVGSNLNSITRIAKKLKIPENSNEVNQGIDRLVIKSNEAIQNVVDVIWTLDNEERELSFLLEKMESYLDYIKLNNKNIQIKFNKENLDESTPLSMDVKHHLLMIFKEAVNNIQKHTNSNFIEIKVRNDSKFYLSFFNNYNSKKENPNSTGKGIINIKKRVSELKGNTEIKETSNSYFLQIELDSLTK